ncbi:mCG147975 [Mus musculus]|jgi:hypothetical protein|nr:mCG147975 [Mus musculus]
MESRGLVGVGSFFYCVGSGSGTQGITIGSTTLCPGALSPLIYHQAIFLDSEMQSKVFCVFSFKIFYFWFMSMKFLPACVYVSGVPSTRRGQKKVSRFPGSGVTDGCELPCGCLEWKLYPLKEKSVLLTTEPVLQL